MAGYEGSWSLSRLPKISVVTPSYNQGQYLRETIESVISQNYPNLEYIIIDGGSSDESVTAIKEYEKQIAYWKSEPDKGQSDAINKGFARATGNIFCWLNSDDQFAPNALWSVALAFIQSKADLVAGICEVYEEDNLIHRHFTSCPDGLLPLEHLLDLDNGWNAGQFFYQPEVFFTRRLWEQAGAHVREDCFYSMDYELWCRFALNKAILHGIGVPLVHFRSHPDQKTADEGKFKTELVTVRDAFVKAHGITWPGSNRPPVNWNNRLRVALVNDLGYKYGAGIAHMRIAGAFDLAGQEVAAFDLLYSDEAEHEYHDVVRRIDAFKPDIVILGNLHGIEKRSIAVVKALEQRYPCFALTHDFWMVTGRCAYMSGCEKYLSGCDGSCPTSDQYPVIPLPEIGIAWQEKRDFLQQAHHFTFLANSCWSREIVDGALSAASSRTDSHVISLGVPAEKFRPSDKHEARRQLNIPDNNFVLVFSVSSLSDERKGGQLLLDALKLVKHENLTLILMGRLDKPVELAGGDLITLGYVEDVDQLVTTLNAADLYIGPSAEETFGQVFVEAALCGTPSIGFDVTGVRDAIVEGITGVKLKQRDAQTLAKAIQTFLDQPEDLARMAFTAPIYARSHFSLESSYRSFFTVLDRKGLIDELSLPHKISFSRVSDLITFSTKGWAELSFPEKCNTCLRRGVDLMIRLFPTTFSGRVRKSLPKPLERRVMRWLSGRKY